MLVDLLFPRMLERARILVQKQSEKCDLESAKVCLELNEHEAALKGMEVVAAHTEKNLKMFSEDILSHELRLYTLTHSTLERTKTTISQVYTITYH